MAVASASATAKRRDRDHPPVPALPQQTDWPFYHNIGPFQPQNDNAGTGRLRGSSPQEPREGVWGYEGMRCPRFVSKKYQYWDDGQGGAYPINHKNGHQYPADFYHPTPPGGPRVGHRREKQRLQCTEGVAETDRCTKCGAPLLPPMQSTVAGSRTFDDAPLYRTLANGGRTSSEADALWAHQQPSKRLHKILKHNPIPPYPLHSQTSPGRAPTFHETCDGEDPKLLGWYRHSRDPVAIAHHTAISEHQRCSDSGDVVRASGRPIGAVTHTTGPHDSYRHTYSNDPHSTRLHTSDRSGDLHHPLPTRSVVQSSEPTQHGPTSSNGQSPRAIGEIPNITSVPDHASPRETGVDIPSSADVTKPYLPSADVDHSPAASDIADSQDSDPDQHQSIGGRSRLYPLPPRKAVSASKSGRDGGYEHEFLQRPGDPHAHGVRPFSGPPTTHWRTRHSDLWNVFTGSGSGPMMQTECIDPNYCTEWNAWTWWHLGGLPPEEPEDWKRWLANTRAWPAFPYAPVHSGSPRSPVPPPGEFPANPLPGNSGLPGWAVNGQADRPPPVGAGADPEAPAIEAKEEERGRVDGRKAEQRADGVKGKEAKKEGDKDVDDEGPKEEKQEEEKMGEVGKDAKNAEEKKPEDQQADEDKNKEQKEEEEGHVQHEDKDQK